VTPFVAARIERDAKVVLCRPVRINGAETLSEGTMWRVRESYRDTALIEREGRQREVSKGALRVVVN